VKLGLPASIALHSALLAWAILSLPGSKTDSVTVVDALPVEFVPIAEATQLRLGQKTAKPAQEIVPKETVKALKDTTGERAGTSKAEELPPPPPPEKKQVAAVSKDDQKPTPPRPPEHKPEPPKPEPKPEPKPVAKPEPKPDEPKPEKPREAEKARDNGEGKPPEVKGPPKDQKALDKILEKAEKKPEPKPVAKPEPKTEAKPAAKPEPTRTASVATPTTASDSKSSFNARDISQILSRTPTGTAASTAPRTASLGSVTGQNSAIKMTQTEVDALIGQIKKCWNPPIGSAEANIRVVMRFSLNQDGTVNGRPSVVSGPAHALGPGLGRSAERAILQCGPYRLPAEKFQTWSDIEATFDPKDL